MAAEEVKRDLQTIRNFLDELVSSAQHTTTEIEKVRRIIEALGKAGRIAGGPDSIVQGLRDIIREASLTENQFLRLTAAADRYFSRQATINRFGDRTGGRFTLGPEVFPERDEPERRGRLGQLPFERDIQVEQRMASLQEWSNALERVTREKLELAEAEEILNRGVLETTGSVEQQIQTLNQQIQALDKAAISLKRQADIPKREIISGRGLQAPLSELAKNPFWTQGIPGGRKAIENVRNELEKLGFSLDDISQVSVDGTRQITRYSGAMTDLGGKTTTVSLVTGKWGNILRSTQKNFRNFASAIQRNVIEVIKWTVAIGLVYGTMRKFQELLTQAIQTQARLADVQVTLGTSAESLNTIFENAAIVSREMGTALTEVIEAYVISLRAAGRYTDETERVQKATQLLRDSMILAKLSGIEQSLALDTLVGALSQTGRELDQGVELLDKWVAVSKEANVSLGTLAESFAITSTAAENVGINIDKLNGIIAAVAEVTTLSATEAGNAVRAFVSGFQTQEAEKALGRYGIAIRDARGELLSFIDVIETIVERQELGIITDRDVARISESIGGGARRGAQVNAFIENYSRVLELSAISANASGDAQEALALKLDTVETALTNLSNAFTELSHALGGKGGFLDAMESGIEFLTGVVDNLKSLIEILGPATKALGAFGIAWLLLAGRGPLKGPITQLGQKIGLTGGGQMSLPGFGPSLADRTGTRFPQTRGAIGGIQSALQNQGFQRVAGGAGIGLLGALASDRMQLEDIAVSIAGGIAGTLIAGPVGGVIGSTIGLSFVSHIEADADAIGGALARAFSDKLETEIPEEGLPPEERIPQLKSQLDEATTDLLEFLFVDSPAILKKAIEESRGIIQEELVERGQLREGAQLTEDELADQFRRFFAEALAGAMDEDFVNQLLQFDVPGMGEILKERFGMLDKETVNSIALLFTELEKAIRKEAEEFDIDAELIGSRIGEALAVTQQAIRPDVTAVGAERVEQLRIESIRGVGGVSVSALRKLREELPLLANQVGVIFQALGSDEERLGAITEDTITDIDALTLAYLKFGDESSDVILDTANNLLVLKSDLEEAMTMGTGEATPIILRIQELEKALAELIITSQKGIIFREFEIPPIIEVSEEALSQMDEIIVEAFVRSEAFMEALGLDETQRDKIIQTYRDAVLGIDGEFQKLDQAVPIDIVQDILRERGLLAERDQPLQVITPDVPSERAPEIRQRIQFFERLLSTIPGFELDPETLGVIFNDFVTDTLHGDNLAIQLALRDLIKVNEDQLEGIFNIPEGMTAFIPFTAAMNLPGARGGLGDYDFSLLETAEERSAEMIVQEIKDVAQAIREGKITIPEGVEEINELRAELRALRDEKQTGFPPIDTVFDAIRLAIPGFRGDGPQPLGMGGGGISPADLLPTSIGVDVVNDIEILVPVYIRGDIIQREVRRYLERDFTQTLSRLGSDSTPTVTYK